MYRTGQYRTGIMARTSTDGFAGRELISIDQAHYYTHFQVQFPYVTIGGNLQCQHKKIALDFLPSCSEAA